MRNILRRIAKTNMRKKGIHKPCQKIGGESYFSKHWHEYV